MKSDHPNSSGGTSASANEQKTLQVLALGGVISLAGAIANIFFNLLSQYILARLLGPGQLGLLNLALSIATIIGLIALFGMHQALLRSVAAYHGLNQTENEYGTTSSALRILTLTNMVVALLLFVGAGFLSTTIFHKPELAPILRALAIGLPATNLMIILVTLAQAYGRLAYRSLIELTFVPLAETLAILIILLRWEPTGFAASLALVSAALMGALAALIATRRFTRPIQIRKRYASLEKEILSLALPFALTNILARSVAHLHTLMLGVMATAEAVGIYSVSSRATLLIQVFLTSIGAVLAPQAAAFYARGDMQGLQRQYRAASRWAFSLALPVGLGMLLLSQEILGLLGAEYIQGARLFQILALAQLFNVLTGNFTVILGMTRYAWLNLFNTGVMLISGLVFGLLLIPGYGAWGAAIAISLGIVLINLLGIGEIYLLLRIHPFQRALLKPLLAGALAMLTGAIIYSYTLAFPTLVCLAITSTALLSVYLLTLLALGLENEEKQILFSLIHRLR